MLSPSPAPLLSSLCAACVALTLAAIPGCSDAAKGKPSARDAARLAYYEAMDDLLDGDYVYATQRFNRIARLPRELKYPALARLRAGDSLFLQERFEEAIEVYKQFIAQYESNPNIPYARYRIAAAYHARLPTEWFMTPPAYEIDQTMTREAVRELSSFVRRFPTSQYVPDARRMLTEAQQMLFDYELYAARYYEENEAWRGAAWRLDAALRDYPALGDREELTLRMAAAFDQAGERSDAARGYRTYLNEFPRGRQRAEAAKRLAALEAKAVDGEPGGAGAPAPPE